MYSPRKVLIISSQVNLVYEAVSPVPQCTPQCPPVRTVLVRVELCHNH